MSEAATDTGLRYKGPETGTTPCATGTAGLSSFSTLADWRTAQNLTTAGTDQLSRFPIGSGYVIQGRGQDVFSMRVDGKHKLAIPSRLACGEPGTGNVIPPDVTPCFEIELPETSG